MRLKLLPLLGGIFAAFLFIGRAEASVQTRDAQFAEIAPSTAPLCVSVSTSAWTAFPPATTANLSGRDGLWLTIKSSSTADVEVLIDKDSNRFVTPTTSQHDFLLKVNTAVGGDIGFSDSFRIWLKSYHTTADDVCGREYRQK